MKVVFFNTYTETPHYETELELMQKHIDQGDEVTQIICDGFFESCVGNPLHIKQHCEACILKRKMGEFLLSIPINKINISSIAKHIPLDEPKFSNIEELKNYKIDDFDIGMGVGSTLISIYENTKVSTEENESYISSSIHSAFLLYNTVLHFLKSQQIDFVYIFNGRFFLERAILRACQKEKVNFIVHERGNSKMHYGLFNNSMPHNIEYIEEQINHLWETEKNIDTKNKIATDFFTSKIQAKDKLWTSFVSDQTEGQLPENWDKKNYNIVIFPSSEHEFSAIGDQWKNKIYPLQLDGILSIINDVNINASSDFKLYLRIHPNLRNAPEEEELILQTLQNKNITIIRSDSKVSTYAVLLACDKVITFGSTMGIEATYWNKPSILAGSCFYQNLKATYTPKNHSELIKFVLDKDLKPLDKNGALKYAYYLSSFGLQFQYYKPITLFDGEFKKINLTELSHRVSELNQKHESIVKIILKFLKTILLLSLKPNGIYLIKYIRLFKRPV